MTSASMRDMYVGIYFRDGATTTLQHLNQVMDNIGDEIVNVGQGLTHTTQGFNHFGHAGISASQNVAHGLNNAETEAGQLNQEVQNVSKTLNGFKSMMRGLAGIVAGVFAANEVKEFGLSSIEAAAGTQAISAQFEQVFGQSQSLAQQTVNQMGKDFGMVPNRIKPAFTKTTSQFLGLGMKIESAMEKAEQATSISANAAAFFDVSMEDAQGSLNSFIKGNYEGGEAIGVFANEAQLAAFAVSNKLVKTTKEWSNLDEATKQATRLDYAENMLAAGGAIDEVGKKTGQASREANSYENQLGNLKQSWTDLKAGIGGPLLQPFVDSMTSASKWMENFDTDKLVNKIDRVVSFAGTAKDTVMSLVNDTGNVSNLWQNFGISKDASDEIASFADTMKTTFVAGIGVAETAFNGFKTGLGWVIDNKELVISGIAGIAGGFTAFKTIKTGLDIFEKVKSIGSIGGMVAKFSNPIGIATIAIGGLITACVYLYQNWDTVKEKALGLWETLKNNPMAALVAGPIGGLIAAGISLYNNWDDIKTRAISLWTTTTEKFTAIKESVSNFVQPAISWFDSLSTKWSDFKSSISNFKVPKWISTIGSTISGAASTVKGWVTGGPDGSHATGLERVPYNGYIAELHKNEAVLTAQQSSTLRSMGILSSNGDGTPSLDLQQNTTPSEPVSTTSTVSTTRTYGGVRVTNTFNLTFHGTNDAKGIEKTIRNVVPQLIRDTIGDMIDTEMQTI